MRRGADMEDSHNLSIEQCKKITATAIISVDSFSDKQIILSFQGGKIVVSGSGMKIAAFSKSTGAFAATGDVFGAQYKLKSGGGIRQKLFK